MTRVLHDPRELRATLDAARQRGARVGLVPTMGALHDGHLSLVSEAKRRADLVVLTIFVNPLQFGPNEDFSRYPRTLEADVARCREAGVDIVFAPDRESMYPPGFSTQVEVSGVTEVLEGVHRPGHFRGVATVVAKLFLLAGPCVAIFGRKDYQQYRVLSRMALDLDMPVEVVGMPTVREPDGLALSSRNRYLDPAARDKALAIARGLRAAHDAFVAGERDPAALGALVRGPIEAVFDRIDYVAVADPETLLPLERPSERVILLVAAFLGTTRLIDNLVLGEDPRP
ncbi:MAG: pantoate--beta-alanine ligase [Polyangiales bacterium]